MKLNLSLSEILKVEEGQWFKLITGKKYIDQMSLVLQDNKIFTKDNKDNTLIECRFIPLHILNQVEKIKLIHEPFYPVPILNENQLKRLRNLIFALGIGEFWIKGIQFESKDKLIIKVTGRDYSIDGNFEYLLPKVPYGYRKNYTLEELGVNSSVEEVKINNSKVENEKLR